MAGNPWFPLQGEPRVLALSAYVYQRGVSLLLALQPSCDAILINSLVQYGPYRAPGPPSH
jgi:hypothetical protein